MANIFYTFKVLIVGSTSVGKSSLLIRYADNLFSESRESTIGVDLRIKTIDLDGQDVKLTIWDTAGQEKFKTIIASYYKGAHAVIFVYDVNDKQSFEDVAKWQNEALLHCNKDPIKILIGNKADLPCRAVSTQEAKKFAQEHQMLHFETSAKTGFQVETAFRTIADKTFKTHVIARNPALQSRTKRLDLNKLQNQKPKANYRCC